MARSVSKTVLVVIPTGDYCERLKLEGVVQYAQEKGGARWSLRLDVGGIVGNSIRQRNFGVYDGIIAYIQSSAERKLLLQTGRPTVLIEDLTAEYRPTRNRLVASIVCDHVVEGRTAARYFLDRHYRNFAFVGTERKSVWGDLRKKGFVEEIRSKGFDVAVFPPLGDLTSWLAKLARPCALFAVRDLRARQVIDAAEELRLSIPHDLSVLGVDNDEILCTTSLPALSSIPTFDREVGYSAGRTLNEIMSGKAKGGSVRTHHTHVISRHSTDADAIDDPFVARALEWARTHLDRKLDAVTLARGIGYSTRLLQKRAEQALGVSISEAIRRIRVATACDLLVNTDFSVAEIATQCGFADTSHLSLRMKAALGLTPLAYRRKGRDLK